MALGFWKSHKSGDWSSAAKWSGNREPGPNDLVLIATAKPQTITVSTDTPGASRLLLASDDTLNVTTGDLAISGSALIVGALDQSDGTLSVGPHSSITGNVDQTGGTLRITGGEIRLAGTDTFAGTIGGIGTLDLTGGSDTLAAGATLNVQELQVGRNALLTVDSNVGTFLENSGTIDVASGKVLGAGGVSTGSALGGTIEGGGTLQAFNAVLQPGLSLRVSTFDLFGLGGSIGGALAHLSLGANASYAGAFNMEVAEIALDDHNLTLSGNVQIGDYGGPTSPNNELTGGGTLTLAGTASIGYLPSSATIVNAGSVTIAAGFAPAAVFGGSAVNQDGAVWTLDSAGLDVDTVNNAGTIIGHGASSIGGSPMVNSGLVQAADGTLALGGVIGDGTLAVSSGASMLFLGSVGSLETALFTSNATLGFNAQDVFGATISGFGAGDVIGLNGMAYGSGSTESFNPSNDQLTVTNGAAATMLQFSGSYSASNFALSANSTGDTGVNFQS